MPVHPCQELESFSSALEDQGEGLPTLDFASEGPASVHPSEDPFLQCDPYGIDFPEDLDDDGRSRAESSVCSESVGRQPALFPDHAETRPVLRHNLLGPDMHPLRP